jgi:GT2 family glycosyltransferase/SAM-dependent methyltransferase
MMAEPPRNTLPAAQQYDEDYFRCHCGPFPYDRAHPHWLEFFGRIADEIVRRLGPKRVLDVGCAMGFLVESLRDRGVEAYGFDISEYAIRHVRPDIRRYCWVASATQPIDGRFDLITCIEVLEHLLDRDGRYAIRNIACHAPVILFSSTPTDFAEPTHTAVRPIVEWLRLFRGVSFGPDLAFDASFVSPHAILLRKRRRTLSNDVLSTFASNLNQKVALQETLSQVRTLHEASTRQAAAAELVTGALREAEGERDHLRDSLREHQTRWAAREAELSRIALLAAEGEAWAREQLTRGQAESTGRIAGLEQRVREAVREQDQLRKVLQGHERCQTELEAERERLTSSLSEREACLQEQRDRGATLQRAVEAKDKVIAEITFHLLAVQRTIGWKLLERVRRIRDGWLPAGSRRWRIYGTGCRVIEVLLDEGIRACVNKTSWKLRQACWHQRMTVTPPTRTVQQDRHDNPDSHYQVWLQHHQLTAHQITEMKAAMDAFSYMPLVSILTPVYNTEERWLRRAIESVRGQMYFHWELCLVNDGSTTPHVVRILDEYAAIDARIKVRQLPRNEGIASASLHALSLASGEFVGLLDHDDELSEDAVFEVVKRLNEDRSLDLLYSDEDKLDPEGRRVEPFFKCSWSPDLLLSMNYITHFSVFRRSVLDTIGGFRRGFDGSQDYDLLLRVTERTDKIAHIPRILYHWRKSLGSTAGSPSAKPAAYEAGHRALEGALSRRHVEGTVASMAPGRYVVRYRLRSKPLVSIIIPTRDRYELLSQCVKSVEEKTSYTHFEIVVLDNDSIEPDTLAYLEAITERWRVHRCSGSFNFSRINNLGVAQAKGDYLLFLNNDTQVVRADWLDAMLEHAQRPEVGAVGAKLLYPDGRIQHAGVVLGIGGVAGHAFKHVPSGAPNYFDLADVVRNCSAVTAACMMVPRRVFEEVDGFDERFRVAFNDIDLCLRIRQRGYLIVYSPLALLYHYESASRGKLHPPEDEELMWRLWGQTIRAGDPYYSPNLTQSREDWSLPR